jgi:hypothetical protein
MGGFFLQLAVVSGCKHGDSTFPSDPGIFYRESKMKIWNVYDRVNLLMLNTRCKARIPGKTKFAFAIALRPTLESVQLST